MCRDFVSKAPGRSASIFCQHVRTTLLHQVSIFVKKKNKLIFGLNLAPIVRVRKLINRSWPVVRVNGSALSETDGSPSCPIQSRHSPLNRGGLDQCVDAVAARMWHNPAEILPKFTSQWTTFRHLFYSLNHLITELKCQNHHQFVEEIEEKSIDM